MRKMLGTSSLPSRTMDCSLATMLMQRWLNSSLQVTGMRQLNGGMINHVWAWQLDGEPGWLVAKLNTLRHYAAFEKEKGALDWWRRWTSFPVPAIHACFADEELGVSGLLMERVRGRNLGEARLSLRGEMLLQREMAAHVAALHACTRPTFGAADEKEQGRSRWLDVFGPAMEQEFQAVRDRLRSRSRDVAGRIVASLDQWLPEQGRPALVHGDLWMTNILVDDAHVDRPKLMAFIDPAAMYADPEYELAYLRLFKTADEHFFQVYQQKHPLRMGFERRCLVYWLNTMLMHVRWFGERYLTACENVIQQLRRW